MVKKIRSINEISGQRMNNDNLLITNVINPICEKYIGFLRSKVFKDNYRWTYHIVLEFEQNTEVVNKLDNTIDKIEEELITSIRMVSLTLKTNFYIMYK